MLLELVNAHQPLLLWTCSLWRIVMSCSCPLKFKTQKCRLRTLWPHDPARGQRHALPWTMLTKGTGCADDIWRKLCSLSRHQMHWQFAMFLQHQNVCACPCAPPCRLRTDAIYHLQLGIAELTAVRWAQTLAQNSGGVREMLVHHTCSLLYQARRSWNDKNRGMIIGQLVVDPFSIKQLFFNWKWGLDGPSV